MAQEELRQKIKKYGIEVQNDETGILYEIPRENQLPVKYVAIKPDGYIIRINDNCYTAAAAVRHYCRIV